jgi:hypothetical protein
MFPPDEHHGVDWRADWIWYGEDPAPYHFHLLARRSFTIKYPPPEAVVFEPGL